MSNSRHSFSLGRGSVVLLVLSLFAASAARAAPCDPNLRSSGEGGAQERELSALMVDVLARDGRGIDFRQEVRRVEPMYLGGNYAKLYGMTFLEAVSVYEYCCGALDYTQLNSKLRAGLDARDPYCSFARVLNTALDKLPDYVGTVYRGSSLPLAVHQEHARGAVVQYRAFTSTSMHEKFLGGISGGAAFVIESRHGKDISGLSDLPDEKEVLFRAGTRFRVKSVKSWKHAELPNNRLYGLEEVE